MVYKLTDEHRAQLKPWADKYIAQALRTTPLTLDERSRVERAIRGLYTAADLSAPKAIIWVGSPIAAAFAATVAAGGIYLMRNPNALEQRVCASDIKSAQHRIIGRLLTQNITHAATLAAMHAAMLAAMRAATRKTARAGTEAATDAVTYEVTNIATYDATYDAMLAVTDDAANFATYDAMLAADETTDDATDEAIRAAAADSAIDEFLLECAKRYWAIRDGGNQWLSRVAWVTFFRYVVKLDLDYSKWDHYEVASIAGPRYMTPDFCIVSELPVELRPAIVWPDGISAEG